MEPEGEQPHFFIDAEGRSVWGLEKETATAASAGSSAPTVQIFQHLTDIYDDVNGNVKKKHEPRYEQLKDRFKKQYGHLPDFYARAPGRVNIIGEHIDYCGYSVLPAAIEQDFVMAVSVHDGDFVSIANIDKDQFPLE